MFKAEINRSWFGLKNIMSVVSERCHAKQKSKGDRLRHFLEPVKGRALVFVCTCGEVILVNVFFLTPFSPCREITA